MSYYLYLEIWGTNVRLCKMTLYAFIKAIQIHTLEPLVDFDPVVPLSGDEHEEEKEGKEGEDDMIVGHEIDWFMYPEDLRYKDDQCRIGQSACLPEGPCNQGLNLA